MIDLKNNRGFGWVKNRNIYVKGNVYDINGQQLNITNLEEKILNCNNLDELTDFVNSIKGSFLIVQKRKNVIYLINDITRTFPLFYSSKNNEWLISDDIKTIVNETNSKPSEYSINEYKCTGYTVGDKTLYENINQLEAAEIVELKMCNEINKNEYWSYSYKSNLDGDFIFQKNKALKLAIDGMNSILNSTDNNQIVVPLSGGYDSRIILSLLKELKYKDVICVTYGSPRSKEINIANKISKKLGFKCITIKYTKRFIKQLFNSDELKDYMNYASNGVSVPHLQDFFAIKYLNKNNLIEKNAIFMPGHSGGIFAGSQIIGKISKDNHMHDVKSQLKRKHYRLNRIINEPNFDYYNKNNYAYSNMESWSWKERQAKFIINSIRTYEYFGYKSFIPLWDKDLADYFKDIDFKYKNRRDEDLYDISSNIYDSMCFELFEKYSINNITRPTENRLIRLLRRVMSELTGYDGVNNLNLIIDELKSKNKNILPKNFNGKIAMLVVEALYDK